MTDLLVVAGEASGDRAAAGVVSRLDGVRAFGLGGPALAGAGAELVGDLRASTAMGIGATGARALHVLRAWHGLGRALRARRPAAALLVGYTEFNLRLARKLRAGGVRVLWYGAPQVWAWRPGRIGSFRQVVDRMAVMLPFEEPIFRRAGIDAQYVGHPAVESAPLDRDAARRVLDLTPFAATVALLPGSRPHEVRRLLRPMLDGYERTRSDRASVDARVLLAPSLDAATRSFAQALCESRRVSCFEVDPREGALQVLRAFDVAICASGTVTLEAALARAVPVVVYRVDLVTELAARALVRTPHVALPNVLLGRRAFKELLQRQARDELIAAALVDALDHRSQLLGACDEVEMRLGARRTPSASVAGLLSPWL